MIVFPGVAKDRTNEDFIKDAKKALEIDTHVNFFEQLMFFFFWNNNNRKKKKSNGVVAYSPLFNFPGIQNGHDCSYDYMHGICEGIAPALVNLWLEAKYKKKEWYIGNHVCSFSFFFLFFLRFWVFFFSPKVQILDSMILKIQVPHWFSRKPTAISNRKHWKGLLSNFIYLPSIFLKKTFLFLHFSMGFQILGASLRTNDSPIISEKSILKSFQPPSWNNTPLIAAIRHNYIVSN